VLIVNVVRIDTQAKKVFVEGGIEEDYDKLIIAAGANSFMPPVSGSDNEGVFTLRTIDDAKAIMEFAKYKKTAVLIGGGLLGIEAAISLTALGLQVAIVEFFDRLLPRQLDKEGAAILQSMLEAKGLKFMLPKQSASIEKTAEGLKVNFKDNTSATGGLVLFSAGIRPNLKIIEGAGINADKGIKVNSYMETNIPDVYAAGDITEFNGVLYGIWPAAKEQGAVGSLGSIEAGPGVETYTEKGPGTFKRLFVKEKKITGAILLGDAGKYQEFQDLMKKGAEIEDPKSLI
jgi:nitrite reductase (NADH) large subunit